MAGLVAAFAVLASLCSMCVAEPAVCVSGSSCLGQATPPSSRVMKDALFADVFADDAFNLLQVGAKAQRAKVKSKGKEKEVSKSKEAAVLKLAADALTVAGASAELLADAGKTVVDMAAEITQETEGRTQEMHENVSPAQHLVHDGTLQRVWHEVEDDEPARKEAAMEAVETLSTADSLMRMVRANFNASAAILLADMVLFCGLIFCCNSTNGFLRCCCCPQRSKQKLLKRPPEVDSLIAGPRSSYGGCSVTVPPSVHYCRAMSQLMINGSKLDENGVPKNSDGHRLAWGDTPEGCHGTTCTQGKMSS
mmetsp:Transcript_22038/g.50342  ORF Transcript_22038/g.50342 Transcript_22038/m.50342 type:complete len:308 (+) Transcript_22038:131-1054(+)